MGNSEKGKPSTSEKFLSPAVCTKEQNNTHAYPEWTAMQAFYGSPLTVPPYVNSAVASHALPHFLCGAPQSMYPPYSGPYAAFYANGGVYAHVGVPVARTSLSIETPVKSSGNTDGVALKKFKKFDGLAISVGNGNDDSTECQSDHKQLDSDETEGSSDRSNRVAKGTDQGCKKRSSQGATDREGKAQKESIAMPFAEHARASDKIMDVGVAAPANAQGRMVENTTAKLELEDPSLNLEPSPHSDLQQSIPKKGWLLNEKELKQERRKQSNRESARRSRLRKQAETEELATKVKGLVAENITLKSEINELRESSEKLRLENAALLDKLRGAQVEQREGVTLHKIGDLRSKPISTENLLERLNVSEDGESYEDRSSGTGPKLHQLLDPSPRTDAVAAG